MAYDLAGHYVADRQPNPCVNCGYGENDHEWVTRMCRNGETREQYNPAPARDKKKG